MSVLRRLFGLEDPGDNLRIIITRHGERVDFTVGNNWVSQLQRNGPRDPRIPRLTPRPDFQDWKYDSPLTVQGEKQSANVGKKLIRLGFPIDFCYSSPAYRAVQTANKILESQGRKNVPIHIEPGMFECPAWYAGRPLAFIPPEYIAKDKRFNINKRYAPFYGAVDPAEDEKQYYRRSRRLIREIIKRHKYQGGTVLLSGHGGSIEAVTRGLRGLRQRRGRPEHLREEALRVSYANFAILERDSRTREWTVRLPESQDDPYGPLKRQSRIPLYGITTENLTNPGLGRLSTSERAAHERRMRRRRGIPSRP